MNKDREILLIKKMSDGYTYTFYADGTYCCGVNASLRVVDSRWRINEERLQFSHDKIDPMYFMNFKTTPTEELKLLTQELSAEIAIRKLFE